MLPREMEFRSIISTGIQSREAKRLHLTNNKAGEHVDGCEYSPDGKYIYYNGSHTGTMQLWRMNPDGSGREQLTNDQYNNWFPHISPDGKWIAFISFRQDVSPNDHPSYKRVMLRLMPASGGEPKDNCISLRWTGNNQCSLMVARQQTECLCKQFREMIIPPSELLPAP